MYKFEAAEADPMCHRVLRVLLSYAPPGDVGADLKMQIQYFLANSLALLQTDQSGPPLNEIFIAARECGISFFPLDVVRVAAAAEKPLTVGAFIIKNALIELTLATECEIIAGMTFVSRDDVDAVRFRLNAAFAPMEELAADEMAQTSYQALIKLHAAVSYYLSQTARPLPQMLSYRFFSILPSVVLGYKLYTDASRCDELRAENKIVHPAFMPLTGRALAN